MIGRREGALGMADLQTLVLLRPEAGAGAVMHEVAGDMQQRRPVRALLARPSVAVAGNGLWKTARISREFFARAARAQCPDNNRTLRFSRG